MTARLHGRLRLLRSPLGARIWQRALMLTIEFASDHCHAARVWIHTCGRVAGLAEASNYNCTTGPAPTSCT
eukprot:8662718-Alexandrium_andersonii.AAC.1